APEPFAAWPGDPHRAMEEPVIERLIEMDDERISRPRARQIERPLRRIGLGHVDRTDAEELSHPFGEGRSFRIEPTGIDLEDVLLAVDESRTELLVGQNAALDPSRIEQDRQAHAARIPQLLVDLEEGEIDDASRGVNEAQALPRLPARHRRGEVDVELEEVLGQNARGGIDLLDDRRWLAHPSRHGELERFRMRRSGPKLSDVRDAGRERKRALEDEEIPLAPISSSNGRQILDGHTGEIRADGEELGAAGELDLAIAEQGRLLGRERTGLEARRTISSAAEIVAETGGLGATGDERQSGDSRPGAHRVVKTKHHGSRGDSRWSLPSSS